MKELTCKDCKNWVSVFETEGLCSKSNQDIKCYANDAICPSFRTKDGKLPRFCLLASSVADMAPLLVYTGIDDFRRKCIRVTFNDTIYPNKKSAIYAAKKWLMEVQE